MVAPFVVAVYCCSTCVEYGGDGQDMKVVEVPWACRSIEGFQAKSWEAPSFSYISKVQYSPGELTGIRQY